MITERPIDDATVRITFAVPRKLGGVSVVGDFNDWQPHVHRLRPRSNGTCSVAVVVDAGRRYRFRYLTETGDYLNDDASDAFEPNGFGETHGIVSA